jgi:hypothetical protein
MFVFLLRFRAGLIAFVVLCLRRFWCETGAVPKKFATEHQMVILTRCLWNRRSVVRAHPTVPEKSIS